MDEAVQRQLSGALTELGTFVEATSDAAERAAAYGAMGELYAAYDLVEPASACWTNARRLAPGELRWAYLLGALYQTDRRLDEALESLETALALRPGDPPTLIRLGRLHLARSEPEKALSLFVQALPQGGGILAAARAGLGQAASALGDAASAVEHYQAALAAQPRASALHYPLAMAYRELGDMDSARRHLGARGDVEVVFPDPLTQDLLQLATGVGVRMMQGNRALRRDDLEQAIGHFEAALAADPRSSPAHQGLATALTRQGAVEGAVRHYSAALALEPENATLHYNLGTQLADRGELAQAVRHFSAALGLVPEYRDARFNLAMTLVRAGRHAEAERHLRRLREADPDAVDVRFNLAETLFQLGRHGEAEEFLSGLVTEDPGRFRARLALGAVRAARGDVAGAAEAYAGVLATPRAGEPARRDAHRGLARARAQEGRYGEAAGHYGEAVALAPEDEPARLGEALALLLGERYAEARERLTKGRQALPGSAALTHLLARLLAAAPDPAVRDGERALELARGLFRADPQPLYAETVAMAYAELGRFDEAVEWQRRLVEEAARAGAAALPRLEERLALYQGGEPCRAPWRR